MRPFAYLTAALAALTARLEADDPERGDVPGWVMITVMTAALEHHRSQLTVHGDHLVHSGGQRQTIEPSVGLRLRSA